jgi:hypothetical protein|tara:strand:- start:2233 stop:2508 length:276 start_codon:yes stop_codon:yes gene_type:complete
MKTKKPNKRKLTIDGVTYKVEKSLYDVLYQLETQVGNHTLALYNYIEIHIKNKNEKSHIEEVLYKYCMQLPYAENVVAEINENIDGAKDND